MLVLRCKVNILLIMLNLYDKRKRVRISKAGFVHSKFIKFMEYHRMSFDSYMFNFSPRENRFLEMSLKRFGRKILSSKSPFEREKRHSPFEISHGEIVGRILFHNLPSDERKCFLGRIRNLSSKLKIEMYAIWPLEVNIDHTIWVIDQIFDIWWVSIGKVRTIIRVENIKSEKNS